MKVNGVSNLWKVYESKKSYGTEKIQKSPDKKDVFTLSDTAKDFQAALRAVNSVPDIRYDKIAEVKNRLNSTDYNVRSEDIADSIMSKSL